MSKTIFKLMLWTALVISFLLSSGCASKTPEQEIAETRSQYQVQNVTCLPQKPPQEPADLLPELGEEGEVEGEATDSGEEASVEAEAVAAEEAEDEIEGYEETEPLELGPQPTDILFDILVSFDGRESLAGLTLDVTLSDPFGKEKALHRQWIETDDMINGDVKQFDFVLEDLPFEDGDGCSVEIRQNLTAADYGDYREFAAVP